MQLAPPARRERRAPRPSLTSSPSVRAPRARRAGEEIQVLEPGESQETYYVCNGVSGAAAGLTIGGTVTGLAAGESVTLTDNGSFDTLTITGDGNPSLPFTFANPIPAGGTYSVAVSASPVSSPTQQDCTVTSGGSGTMEDAGVTNVEVDCTACPGRGCACNPLAAPDPTLGVFVSAAFGSDSNGTGGPTSPYATITKGIGAANAAGLPNVYVGPGTYSESLTLVNSAAGTSVQGGWIFSGASWGTDCSGTARANTVLKGGAIAVQANNVPQGSGLSFLTIQTESSPSSVANTDGTSVIGVLVDGTSSISLSNVAVVAGNAGNAGPPAPPALGGGVNCAGGYPSEGSTGAPASAPGTFGPSGFTPADGHPGTAGGDGENGGEFDPQCLSYTTSCGEDSSGDCVATGGGVVCGNVGEGGCGGVGGGGGNPGLGGGASAAVVIAASGATVNITSSVLQSGSGGAGSGGGPGGGGWSGSAGGVGAQKCVTGDVCGFVVVFITSECEVAGTDNVCAAGSTGESGGFGGNGGNGGGGAGGPSYALVNVSGAALSMDTATILSAGAGGSGGNGAPSGGIGPRARRTVTSRRAGDARRS